MHQLQVYLEMKIIILLLLAIASEAIAEIITSSELTDPFRRKWKKWTYREDKPPTNNYFQYFKVFIDKLVSCGYCTSVWTSAFVAIWSPTFLQIPIINWLVMTLVIHRLSNWVHVLYELIRKGRVKTHDLLVKIEVSDGEIDGAIGESKGEAEPEA